MLQSLYSTWQLCYETQCTRAGRELWKFLLGAAIKSEKASLRCRRIKLILFMKLRWVMMIHNQNNTFWTNSALPSSKLWELTPDTFLLQTTHLPTLLFTNVTNCYNDWLTRSSLSAVACFPANSHWGSPTAPDHLKLFLIVGHLTYFDWWYKASQFWP